MNFASVRVVGFESNFHEQLFLEAWHSTLDPNAGNDHIARFQNPTKASREHEIHPEYMVTRASFALRYFKDVPAKIFQR